MSYTRPIIVEIYAELGLQPGTLPFDRFFDLVPQLRGVGFPVLEPGEVVANAGSTPATRLIRCWSEDRLRLVQIAEDTVVVNLVSPDGTYPGWDTFIAEVVTPALKAISAAVPGCIPQAVSLNTIDTATLPFSSEFQLGQYLNCGGPRIPAILADTAVAFAYDAGRGILQADGYNKQLHVDGTPRPTEYLVPMHSIFQRRVGSIAEVVPTLRALHDESNASFESLITDKMRSEVMKGTVTTDANSRL